MPEIDLDYRTENIVGQLTRYGGRIANAGLARIIEELVEVNDDMWHLRHDDLIVAGLNKAIAASERLRDRIMAEGSK